MDVYDLPELVGSAAGAAESVFGESAEWLGPAVSGMTAAGELGTAVYDAFNGDRDGAVDQGVRGLWNTANALPAVSDVSGKIDDGLGMAGGIADQLGLDSSYIPASVEDGLAGAAVWGTNALFGADEDPGTATDQGRFASGLAGMGANLGVGLGPLGIAMGALNGWDLGNALTGGAPAAAPAGVGGGAAATGDAYDWLL